MYLSEFKMMLISIHLSYLFKFKNTSGHLNPFKFKNTPEQRESDKLKLQFLIQWNLFSLGN